MQKKPNILFCIADDAGMHFGAYGCPWVKTPAFDRVAKDGLLFQQAYTCNAKCAPSRAAILTGRNSWQLKDAANHQCFFPAEFKTVMEELPAHGYHVGVTSKGWEPGDPGKIDGKPRQLAGPRYNEHKCTPPTKCICPTDYAANFEAFLDGRPDDTPFCFWYGCREPHRRYEYKSGIDKNGHRPEDVDEVYDIWPDNEVVRTDLLDYGFEIEYFDSHLARMLAALEERGELSNTLVIVTSDNGMPFPNAKGQEYYYSNHLPLAMMWADGIKNPGRHIEDMVSFIDFAPTFLDVADVDQEDTGMAPITGQSLTDIFNSEATGLVSPSRDRVLIGKERHDIGRPGEVGYPIRGIFEGDYLYLRNFEPARWPVGNPETGYPNLDCSPTKSEILKLRGDPENGKYWDWTFGKRPAEELFNVKVDPGCLNNLAADGDHETVRSRMAARMLRELEEQGDPRITGEGTPLDENPVAYNALHGFYTRFVRGEAEVPGWLDKGDMQTP